MESAYNSTFMSKNFIRQNLTGRLLCAESQRCSDEGVPVWSPCEQANGLGGGEAKEEGKVTPQMRQPGQRDPGVRLVRVSSGRGTQSRDRQEKEKESFSSSSEKTCVCLVQSQLSPGVGDRQRLLCHIPAPQHMGTGDLQAAASGQPSQGST